MTTMIRRLDPTDASALVALRREALDDAPLAFLAAPADDVGLVPVAVERFLGDREGQAVFGAYEGDELVGMIGIVRASKQKQRHVATIWGTYVTPRARGRGRASMLLDAAIGHARAWPVRQLVLGVTDAVPGARRLYERAGFRVWGREPDALEWNGRFVAEDHMVLRLEEEPS